MRKLGLIAKFAILYLKRAKLKYQLRRIELQFIKSGDGLYEGQNVLVEVRNNAVTVLGKRAR